MSAPTPSRKIVIPWYVTPCRGRVASVSRACREHVKTCRARVASVSRACRAVSLRLLDLHLS
eukprot:2842100-Prymnesium_polylepis.1